MQVTTPSGNPSSPPPTSWVLGLALPCCQGSATPRPREPCLPCLPQPHKPQTARGPFSSLGKTLPALHVLRRYLIGAPVPQGEDGQPEDEPGPRQVSPEGISKDVEGVIPWGVALLSDGDVSLRNHGWNGIHVLFHEGFIPSHFMKSWKIPVTKINIPEFSSPHSISSCGCLRDCEGLTHSQSPHCAVLGESLAPSGPWFSHPLLTLPSPSQGLLSIQGNKLRKGSNHGHLYKGKGFKLLRERSWF